MSSSRSRTRVAAIVAAVPVLVVGGPALSPAYAVDSVRQAALVDTLGDLRIGPRAGFRGDVSRGVNGNTAIVAIDAATSTTLQKVAVAVTQDVPFSIYDDFDQTDGFALYKDLDDNDRLDPADLAAGPVSLPRYDVGFSNGAVLVTVNADTTKATGQDSYLLTVHPSLPPVGVEKVVRFAIPANGVVTSAGTIPPAVVTLDEIVLDSKAPSAIPIDNFVPVNRAPVETCPPNASCGDDAYKVHRAVAGQTGEKLGFFNAAGDLTDGALLKKKVGDTLVDALYDVPVLSANAASPTELSIGNGTGRDSTVNGSRALNNQISDDVFAVQWDLMGNVVSQTLGNTPTCDQNVPPSPTCPEQKQRGNDVTAPAFSSYSAVMDPIQVGSDPSNIRVRGTFSGFDTGVSSFVKRTAVAQLARPEHVQQVPGSNPAEYAVVGDHRGTEKRSSDVTPTGGSLTIDTFVDVSDNTTFPQNERVRSQYRIVDAFGNAMVAKPTVPVLKDTVAPSFVKISLVDANTNGDADPGEVYRVLFDDPMDVNDITAANVNTALDVVRPGPACNGVEPKCVDWGREGLAVAWSPDQRVLSITLGEPCTAPSQSCTQLTELPQTADLVTAAATVTDPNGNQMQVPNRVSFPISAPTVVPISLSTRDRDGVGTGVFGTARDGVLDAIDVKFTGNIDANSVLDSSTDQLWKLTWNGTVLTPTASLLSGTTDTVRLLFTVPANKATEWHTGATPSVALNPNGQGSTRVQTTGVSPQAIAPFSLSADDAVAPLPISITTADTSKNGKIDQVLVKFAEAIVHGAENVCGWTVTGYTDSNYKPHGFPSAVACSPARNKPNPVPSGATASDTVALTLAENASAFDTGATPFVQFLSTNTVPSFGPGASPDACYNADVTGAPGVENCPVVDVAGNGVTTFSAFAVDATGPAIVSRATADANSDGRLDRIDVTFSETVSTPSIASGVFALTEPAYTLLSIGVTGPTVLALNIQPIGAGGDTGVTPKLTYSGGITDTVPNASPTDTGVVVTDKAGPAILAACAGSATGTNGTCPVDDATKDKVAVKFSEPVASASVAQTDFAVEQPVGTVKTITAAALDGTVNTQVNLEFAEGAIKLDQDGVVRLATGGSANGVTDAAAAPNASTQTTNVPIYKAPIVTLNLTCPVPAKPGYCSATTINTGAAGTSGVRFWRLAETARGTTPPDSEFSSTIPTTYPPTGVLTEGSHTLYLSGKDDFGRLSPEVSATITILKDPKIGELQFVNPTTRRSGSWSKASTVLDGDTILIGANAYGTDAAQWAAGNAATGGGCLSQHMSIDLRSLTGVSTHSAVPPLKCDLKTTTTPPYRQMQFPTVKAAKTTRYPVGTVLRTSSSDPGSLIVDGPSGTQRRRQFISVAARRSWMIPDASVITVPSSLVGGISRTTNLGYREGAILRTSSGYYYVQNGTKRPVSTAQLAAWRIPTSTAYAPTATELKAIPTGTRITGTAHASGTFIKYTSGAVYQIVRKPNGTIVRRKVASTGALRTRVPSTHVYAANSSDSKLPVDSWLLGYRDGTVLKLSNGTYGVIARGSLRKFANAATFNTLGYSTSNALTMSGSSMPRVNGQTYRTGAAIDRYKLANVVIKVTNKAGAVVTAIVPNSGGLYGVGTFDAIPTGWDTSR